MKTPVKFIAIVTLACIPFLPVKQTQAQTLAKNTKWIKKQLNKLVVDVDEDDDEDETPKFMFKGCQMTITLVSKDVSVNTTWQLGDVRNISYKRKKNGEYLLMLAILADKVKMVTSLGSFPSFFDRDGKDKDNKDITTLLALETKNEILVKQIKQKLDESIQFCRQGNE